MIVENAVAMYRKVSSNVKESFNHSSTCYETEFHMNQIKTSFCTRLVFFYLLPFCQDVSRVEDKLIYLFYLLLSETMKLNSSYESSEAFIF